MTLGEKVASRASDTAVRMSGVGMVFGRGGTSTVALDGLDLVVGRGEVVVVVGRSGCGKSTLLSLAAGLESPTTGSVDVTGRVALMFQDATLLPWLTARQNVELALKTRGVARAQRREAAERLLEVVRLSGQGDRRPYELSGGMSHRVSLARALAQDATTLLMDEPFGALDAMTRDHLHEEVERIASDERLSILLVTHNMREAVRLGDRVVLLGDRPGRVVFEQTVALPRPRVMDSADVAERAASLLAELRSRAAAA
jgi:NitT/TauT family transport system ATP-binding protein